MCHVRLAPQAPRTSKEVAPVVFEPTLGQKVLSAAASLARGALAVSASLDDNDVWDDMYANQLNAEAREKSFALSTIAAAQRAAASTVPPSAPKSVAPRCPGCGQPLTWRSGGGAHYAACAGCGAVFLDRGSVPWALHNSKCWPELSESVAGLPTGAPDTRLRYLACPACGVAMARKNFQRVSGIIVDECLNHGIWFDPGELARALAFLREGGNQAMARFEANEQAHLASERARIHKIEAKTEQRRRNRFF